LTNAAKKKTGGGEISAFDQENGGINESFKGGNGCPEVGASCSTKKKSERGDNNAKPGRARPNDSNAHGDGMPEIALKFRGKRDSPAWSYTSRTIQKKMVRRTRRKGRRGPTASARYRNTCAPGLSRRGVGGATASNPKSD